ncbi:Uma2 family endonuclease [Streptomyces sp. BE20]|nr:Uma2 family endonuclease [Streptomyces sp. BE20]
MFRLVLEVTSSSLSDDLKKKPSAYASAGVPVRAATAACTPSTTPGSRSPCPSRSGPR